MCERSVIHIALCALCGDERAIGESPERPDRETAGWLLFLNLFSTFPKTFKCGSIFLKNGPVIKDKHF